MATFRGYADQRHVTVLALRDERHRNQEVAAELAEVADTASALSHFISQSLKDDQHHQHQRRGREGATAAEEDFCAGQRVGSPEASPSLPGGDEDRFDPAQSPAAVGHESAAHTDGRQQLQQQQEELAAHIADERMSFEAVRRALADARAELGRKARALQREIGRRQAAEGRVLQAEVQARAAGKRAHAAEAAAARANGRVSVLERNVEYLKTQQRALR